MAAQTYDVSVEWNVPARLRDGTTLYADVYRPRGDGPFPVLLQRTPYDKTSGGTYRYNHPTWYARRGFIVAIQDCRGRWKSEGDWYPFANEARDGYDAVEWAARLPGANGKVGMYGGSYVGATQVLAAVEAPPALAGICPCVTASDYYEGWTYEGGALHLAFTTSWAMALATDTARRRGDADLELALSEAVAKQTDWFRTLPLAGFPPLKPSGVVPYFFDWLQHSSYDDYWQSVSPQRRHGRVTAPALHIGGWYDIFLDGTLKNYAGIRAGGATEQARRGQRLLVGPWLHNPMMPVVGAADFGPAAASGLIDDLQVRLYNWWLRGEDDGISQEPPVKLFVMGENAWRDEQEWPLKRAQDTEYYFHSDGRANALTGDGLLSRERPADEPYDSFIYDPGAPVPSLGGHSCCSPGPDPEGSFDQRPVEMDRSTLCFTSAPLTAPLDVIGPVSVELWAATTAVDTDWVAKLVDVYPDGRAMNLTQGILRARYRDGTDRPQLLERDRVYRYRINLRATANVFLPGHRIRVDVTSSSFPHWDANANTGAPIGSDTIAQLVTAVQTVFHDPARPSHILLPVVPRG